MSTDTASPRRASDAAPEPDYLRFCQGIRTLTGIDLGQYRPAQMERRLRTFAERTGAKDLDAYLASLRGDAALDAFLDRMTINVSELFRNPERFQDLERNFLPKLVAKHPGGLRIWSAGCSYGAEIYSLHILAKELAPSARHELLAFDIDERILARAHGGVFQASDMSNVTPERRKQWFTEENTAQGPRWRVKDDLRRGITFRRFDLLRDPFPRSLHLIACRNVVIYFNDDAKDALFRKFFEALNPGGLLFVGSTERVNGAERIGYGKAGAFLYNRPD